jgi:hypothetical protein
MWVVIEGGIPMAMLFQHRSWRGLALALVIASSACTTVTVTPQATQPPPQTYHVVIIGKGDNPDPRTAYLDTYFREGLMRRLGELKAFDNVSQTPPATAAPDTLFVTGWVSEADKGDEALRFFVGMGAGREHVTGQLELKNSDGQSLGRLEIRKAYSGGMGMGGATVIDLEELSKQVGEQAAQTLFDWSKGKPVAN